MVAIENIRRYCQDEGNASKVCVMEYKAAA